MAQSRKNPAASTNQHRKKSQQNKIRQQAQANAKAPYTFSLMQIALSISVFAHIIFLSVHFEAELRQIKDRLPVLEVTLVNTKTKTKPKDADIFAQANLDRGGNTQQDRQMTSALPATAQNHRETAINAHLIKKSTKQNNQSKRSKDEEAAELKRLEKLQNDADALMVQLKSMTKVETKKVQASNKKAQNTTRKKTEEEKKQDKIKQAMLEITRLEAKIAKDREEYQKRPKRKFIGARAKEYRYAIYVDKWRQKVEKIGNENYPQAAKKLKLYGKLQMTVSIKKDGSIEQIEVDRSSGHRVLDAAAQHIVELGAPYEKFPDNIKQETDILSITRTWSFTKENGLISEFN